MSFTTGGLLTELNDTLERELDETEQEGDDAELNIRSHLAQATARAVKRLPPPLPHPPPTHTPHHHHVSSVTVRPPAQGIQRQGIAALPRPLLRPS